MTAEVIDGQLDLLELLGSADSPVGPVSATESGAGAWVAFHVRVAVVREDGSRYLTTDQHCGFCGSGSLSSVGSGAYCGMQDDGDHWSLAYCGRCQDRYLHYRSIERLVREGVLYLVEHEVPDGCDVCARLARGGSLSCGTHRKGSLFDHHVCVVCGRAFTGHGRGGQILGFGPVTAPYCSEPCGKPASAFLRALHSDLTTNANHTTQED
ncbi:hypothetical protein E7Z53_07940 [Kocuria salina]|uniref:hypothetical protein n=1 Tax=Kocuria salina TaxID=1929416 RepID=UPI00159339EE|nr:hypothetical protein [Kocuria salina]NVC23373.1 hypothetical protein [Kocuria salina]